MANNTCETIRLGCYTGKPGINVRVVTSGQSLEAVCQVTAAAGCRAIWHKAASGKTNAGGRGVEV